MAPRGSPGRRQRTTAAPGSGSIVAIDLAAVPAADAAAALARAARAAAHTMAASFTAAAPLQQQPRARRHAAAPGAPAASAAPRTPAALPPKLAAPLAAALEALLSGGALQSLHLGLRLPPACLARFAAALGTNRSLRELSLAGSGASDAAVQALREPLAAHPQLRALDLSRCGLTADGAALLAGALAAQRARRCELAWVHGLRSSADGAAAAKGGSPRHREQQQQRAEGAAAPPLLPPLARDRAHCLTRLVLSFNPALGNAGGAALAAALRDDCRALADGCGAGAGLRELVMHGCQLSQASADAFRAALAEAPGGSAATGIAVDLRGNGESAAAACGSGGGPAGRGAEAAPVGGVLWGPLPAAGSGAKPRRPRRVQPSSGGAEEARAGAAKKAPAAVPAAATAAAAPLLKGPVALAGSLLDAMVRCQDKQQRTRAAASATSKARQQNGHAKTAGATPQAGALSALQQSFQQAEALVGALEARLALLLPPDAA